MTKVAIGDQVYETEPLSFRDLKRVMKIMATMDEGDGVDSMDKAGQIVLIALRDKVTPDQMDTGMTAAQAMKLDDILMEIMRENEMDKKTKPGEATVGAATVR